MFYRVELLYKAMRNLYDMYLYLTTSWDNIHTYPPNTKIMSLIIKLFIMGQLL